MDQTINLFTYSDLLMMGIIIADDDSLHRVLVAINDEYAYRVGLAMAQLETLDYSSLFHQTGDNVQDDLKKNQNICNVIKSIKDELTNELISQIKRGKMNFP